MRIALSFPERSENCVKNKFYGTLRKVVRSMNRIMSSQSGKKKKKIRYESVIRVIEAAESFLTLTSSLKEESIVLRQQIFSLARGNSNSLTNQQIFDLGIHINNFNLKTRSFRSRKQKNPQSLHEKKLSRSKSRLLN